MDKKQSLDNWKKAYKHCLFRGGEIGEVLSGETLYMFDDLFDIIHESIRDLYDLDDSEWNFDLTYDYLNDKIDYETFLEFTVNKNGSYEGLRARGNSRGIFYWREPELIVDNSKEDIE